MKHTLAAAAALVLFGAADASAQITPATGSVTATATVNGRARLDISSAAISFADADPTAMPSIQANVTLTILAQVRTAPGTAVELTVAASGPFTSAGGDNIALTNLTWTTTGAGFAGGTGNTTAQPLGAWSGPGARNGTQTYFLLNSWDYAPGTYTTTLNYTLSVP